jgi:hypothetical protein
MKNKIIISFVIVLAAAGLLVFRNNSPLTPLLQQERETEGKKYQNDAYNFSINIPNNATTTEIDEGEGHTILIQKEMSKTVFDTYQMQIYMAPFDEDIVLTAERIRQDIPDLKMGNIESVKVGGITAVKFIDQDQNTGEIWFVRNGNLFQVSSDPKNDSVTEKIMQSWKWKI